MKNIKETIIGVFAVIGFVVIVSGFTTNNATQETANGTHESHVWEMHLHNSVKGYFSINKVTGEVRAYDLWNSNTKNFKSVYSVSYENKVVK